VAAIATVETAAANRTARLRDYYEFHRTAVEEARAGTMRRIVVLPDADETNAARLATLLLRQGVEVRRLSGPYAASAHAYLGGPSAGAERRTFPAGAYVIDLAQPEGRMARALLEPNAEMDQAFYDRQVEMYERNRRRAPGASGERYEFYDLTAWSLPLAMGLDAYWTDDTRPVEAVELTLPQSGDAVRAIAPSGGRERPCPLGLSLRERPPGRGRAGPGASA
jgi:hypothetical protein